LYPCFYFLAGKKVVVDDGEDVSGLEGARHRLMEYCLYNIFVGERMDESLDVIHRFGIWDERIVGAKYDHLEVVEDMPSGLVSEDFSHKFIVDGVVKHSRF